MPDTSEAPDTLAPDTEQDRLEKLEKNAKLDRLLILALAAALLLSLLGWVSVALWGGAKEEAQEALVASQASVDALQKELAAQQLLIGTLQQQVQDQNKLILLIQKQPPAPSVPSTSQPANKGPDSVHMVARTLIGQERNYQQSIAALKTGMRDLAHMVAGSRSWLAFYEEALNKPLADSQARVEALEKWSDSAER